ncbi:hypothetical protein BJ878DRAFT_558459 [Calycina marina]|uniref:Uncharacterized protein n=1 Tax=Calycina marina TaxID=1763456 RepID=A0A9P7Z8B0_9HELO|nr:hypothetical protein BJ878DRAFT_558459 [Calycina marina]
MLIFAILGMVFGQIRTLQLFGWLVNLTVWMTIVSILISIGVSAHSAPNYEGQLGSYRQPGSPFGDTNFPNGTIESHIPTEIFAGALPDGYASGGTGSLGTYQGLNSIVYAYGGAMLFFNLTWRYVPWCNRSMSQTSRTTSTRQQSMWSLIGASPKSIKDSGTYVPEEQHMKTTSRSDWENRLPAKGGRVYPVGTDAKACIDETFYKLHEQGWLS